MIVEFVREHGCKWRLIASLLEGRSDDAVRNRWNRVKDLPVHNGGREPVCESTKDPREPPETTPPCPHNDNKPERVSWSRTEDEVILQSVSQLGHKWNKIATRLPGRTGHAIRNRFSRLQALVSRGHMLSLSSGQGTPIGIALIPNHDHQRGRDSGRPQCSTQGFISPS